MNRIVDTVALKKKSGLFLAGLFLLGAVLAIGTRFLDFNRLIRSEITRQALFFFLANLYLISFLLFGAVWFLTGKIAVSLFAAVFFLINPKIWFLFKAKGPFSLLSSLIFLLALVLILYIFSRPKENFKPFLPLGLFSFLAVSLFFASWTTYIPVLVLAVFLFLGRKEFWKDGRRAFGGFLAFILFVLIRFLIFKKIGFGAGQVDLAESEFWDWPKFLDQNSLGLSFLSLPLLAIVGVLIWLLRYKVSEEGKRAYRLFLGLLVAILTILLYIVGFFGSFGNLYPGELLFPLAVLASLFLGIGFSFLQDWEVLTPGFVLVLVAGALTVGFNQLLRMEKILLRQNQGRLWSYFWPEQLAKPEVVLFWEKLSALERIGYAVLIISLTTCWIIFLFNIKFDIKDLIWKRRGRTNERKSN